MPTSPARAAITITTSWAAGRKSCRDTVRRVVSASIGHSTIHPATTKAVAAPAIAAMIPSSASVRTPTTAPITAPRSPATTSRVSAAGGIILRLGRGSVVTTPS
jgi:hypothetical protein